MASVLGRYAPTTPLASGMWSEGDDPFQPNGDRQLNPMIEKLRRLVVAPPANCERFYVIFLGQNNVYLGISDFGYGRINGYTLRLRDLFRRALLLEARSMIVAHNHPSGDCRPSAQDIRATQQLGELAYILEIELLDHLIFTLHEVYSMRGKGKL